MKKIREANEERNLLKIRVVTKRVVTKEQSSHTSKRSTDDNSHDLQKKRKLKDLALAPAPAPALAPPRALATAVAPAPPPALARPPAPAAASTPSLTPSPTPAPLPPPTPAPALAPAPAPATTPAPPPPPTPAPAPPPPPTQAPAPPPPPTPAPAPAPATTPAPPPPPTPAPAPAPATTPAPPPPLTPAPAPATTPAPPPPATPAQAPAPATIPAPPQAPALAPAPTQAPLANRALAPAPAPAPAAAQEKPQRVGPSDSGGGKAEETRGKRTEDGHVPVEQNATMEQEAFIAELTPSTSELQKVKILQEELDRRRGFTAQLKKKIKEDMERLWRRFKEKVKEEKGKYQQEQIQLKKKMEEEMERIKRRLDEKVEEEKGRYQQEQMQIVDMYQKMFQVDKQANEMWEKFIEQTGPAASSSSQVPKHRSQLGSQPRPIQPVWKDVPSMGTAQTGGHSGSMFHSNNTCSSSSLSIAGPHIVSTSSHHPSADTVLPHPTTAPEQYHSQPHLSAPLAISTSTTVASTSSQRFAPSAGTPLRHPNRALSAELSASAPHSALSGPHLSVIPAMSTPAPVATSTSQWIGSSSGTSIWHSGLAPEAALSASEPRLPFSDSIASWMPCSAGLLPHPAPAPGVVLQAPVPHLTYGPARMQVGHAGHTQIQNNCLDSLRVSSSVISGPRSINPNNGNTNCNAAGTSGGRNDDTGSGGGWGTVNGDGFVCLSDDE